MLTLADILKALTGEQPEWVCKLSGDMASLVVSEAAIDSRQIIPAAMFVALQGEHTDGHEYVEAALNKGAIVALIEKEIPGNYPVIDLSHTTSDKHQNISQVPFCIRVDNSLQALQKISRYWRRQLDVRVVGITGSVGKSTTKELVASVLRQRYYTLKNPGNLNNEIGLPLTLLRLGKGHQRAVTEMGFYIPGEIEFLCDLALPSIGVITSIGSVHAERAGSIEAIAHGKAELIRSLPPEPEGIAVLNYDDALVKKMAEQTSARIFYYGLSPEADLWADNIEGLGLEGIRLRLHYQSESFNLRVPLIGQHSVHTVLRAAAVGLVEGLPWQEIIVGLIHSHSQLRLVGVHTSIGALILDDTYNATPESTLAALNLLNEMEGRKVAVLGDMRELGQYEQKGHEIVGHRAAQICDELVAVGPISKIIAEAARAGGMAPASIYWVETVQEAIEYLKPRMQSQDIVLIKGSHGLRMDRIVAALENVMVEDYQS